MGKILFGWVMMWCLCCNVMTAAGSDWPMFMGNSQHSGSISPNNSPKSKSLKLLWQYSLYSQVSASPVVSGEQLFIAAENGNIYSFDLGLKNIQWLYHTEAGIGSTPAVAQGIIYFLSRDGFFYALEQSTGKLLWRFATGGERRFGVVGGYGLPEALGVVPDPWDFYLSSPLVRDGTVFFGSSDHHIYALDAKSGTLIWSFKTDESIHSSPVYANGKIFIGSWGTKLYALNAGDGTEVWHFQGGTDYKNGVLIGMEASPSVDDENVYIGSRDGFFHALKQNDGQQLWRYDAAGSWVLSTAAVDENNVYFATSDTGLFIAANKKTGTEIYRTSTRLWSYTSPALVENRIFLGTMAGELYMLEKTSGKKIWKYQTAEGRADVDDVIDDKTGALRSEKLFAPERQVQSGVEYVKELGAFVASPIWINDELIAVTATGHVLVFK